MRFAFNDTCERLDENSFSVLSEDRGTEIRLFQDYPMSVWNSSEVYEEAGVHGYEPMTAKELDTEERQDEAFAESDNFIEEKFDGTRGLMYFFSDETGSYCRIFSRRISKKTGFYVENSDALPQLKVCDCPELAGTIIDGELFIDGRPFKDVSSTLNCLWDKAIDRQIELGFITFHAFDIIAYRGLRVRNTPLYKRKKFLDIVVREADNQFLTYVPSYLCGSVMKWNIPKIQGCTYYATVNRRCGTENIEFDHDVYKELAKAEETNTMTPRAYYELIVATGGEGVIVKPRFGKYLHKRGWEYSKVKKFLTREMIIMRFSEPTREYTGKAPADWEYWEGNTPVTKHYYNHQVGNLVLGVVINKADYENIPKNKRGEAVRAYEFFETENTHYLDWYVMEVCECSGFDDEMREWFTENRDSLKGAVVEVKANEIMRDTGRLRHPRFERMRPDKEAERCTWSDHII